MSTMRVVQVPKPGAPFEIVERPIPAPGPGEVRIKVGACGICHSDSFTKDGLFQGIQYPRVPGHEVAGLIDAVGPGVKGFAAGEFVGVGWHGGYCGECANCVRGDFFACVSGQVTGLTRDGGYGEYLVTPATSVAHLPQELSAVEAAPLLCAGITTYNALRNCGARGGDVVAVHGLGGLGHLGTQYAAKMGFHTVVIARGQDKAPLAKQLGADHYIDSQSQDASAELLKLGGAKAILATVVNAEAMASVQKGLATNGTLLLVGGVPSLSIDAIHLLMGRRSIKGWNSGTAIDSQDTVEFSVRTGVRSMNEIYPLDRVREAYERMISGKARFRVVLKMD
ncbi:MAG: alcohol dehydrogenase [Pirellulaceae bacterium]|nr:alcohol dehydrogenase [Pirellulaceae bacterium]